MAGRFEEMSGDEPELSEAFSQKKHGKGAECLLPLAEGMAFRRKAQRIAVSDSCICAERGADLLEIRSIRRIFFLRKRMLAHGYKGEGVLVHLLADADGMPLAACSAPAHEDVKGNMPASSLRPFP